MKKIAILALVAMISATGAVAADDERAADETKEKKICRSEKMTGSLTRVKRICMTEREWRELAANTKRSIDDLDNPIASGQGQAGGAN